MYSRRRVNNNALMRRNLIRSCAALKFLHLTSAVGDMSLLLHAHSLSSQWKTVLTQSLIQKQELIPTSHCKSEASIMQIELEALPRMQETLQYILMLNRRTPGMEGL